MVGWLFWVYRPFETVFQSISDRLPERGRQRIDESKMSKQPPPAPTASAGVPCSTIIQIIGRPGTGSLPRAIASPDHPFLVKYFAPCERRMFDKLTNFLCYTDRRLVVAVFSNIFFLVTDIIVLSESIFWLHKLGVFIGIIPIYFLK